VSRSPASSASGTLWGLGGIACVVAGFFLAGHFWQATRAWASLLVIASSIVGFLFCISRVVREQGRTRVREADRFRALESDESATRGHYEIRRAPVRRWPTIITLLCAVPPIVFLLMGDVEIAAVFLLFSSTIALVSWLVAWAMGTGLIATLTPTGIRHRNRDIRWDEIQAIGLAFLPKIETGQLTVRLARARVPITLGERINSTLSGGHSDREIVISLARSAEPAEVIHRLVQRRWEDAVGARRASEAYSIEAAERAHAARRWPEFTAREKRRTLFVFGCVMAVVIFGVHGVVSDFRPSPAWFDASLVVSGALTLAGVVKLLRSRVLISARNQQGTPSYIALFLLFGVFGGILVWGTIGWSWGSLATRAVGVDDSRMVTYAKKRERRKRCRHRVALQIDERWPLTVCVDKPTDVALPPRGTVRIQLRESWFGVHIVSVSTVGN
jgi:hypothetical protein